MKRQRRTMHRTKVTTKKKMKTKYNNSVKSEPLSRFDMYAHIHEVSYIMGFSQFLWRA